MQQSNKDQAIALADKYKQIELEVITASPGRRIKLLRDAARIAIDLKQLGYSLPQLVQKRDRRYREAVQA